MMAILKKIKTISELHSMLGYEKPKHPLITLVDLTKVKTEPQEEEVFFAMDFYAIVCKSFEGTLKYGRSIYDFQEGSLIFHAPGQVLSSSPDLKITDGWALYFHPDLLYGTDLYDQMEKIPFDILERFFKESLKANVGNPNHSTLLQMQWTGGI